MDGFSLFQMPFKNIAAHPVRAIVLMLLAAAQAACVLAGVVIASGSQDVLSLAEERLGADVIVYPNEAAAVMDMDKLVMQGTPIAVYAPRTDLDRISDCDGIETVSCQVYLPGGDGGPLWVVGFDPETDFALAPWIEEGRDSRVNAGNVMVGCNVETQGNSVDVYGKPWPVGAHLMKTGSVLDDCVFARMEDIPAMIDAASEQGIHVDSTVDPLRDYSAALVRVTNKEDVESVANWLKVYVRKTKAVQSDAALTETAAGINWQSIVVGALAALAWVVLLTAIAIAQSMSLRERRAELFAWRASGASRKTISSVLRKEAIIVHCVGALCGVVIAGVVLVFTGNLESMPLSSVAIFGIAAVGLSILSGVGAASMASSKTVDSLDGQMLVAG